MTYDKDVFGTLPKKKRAAFHHPMGFELYDALAMDLHAMTYAEQCVAAVRAKSAEADLLEALIELADCGAEAWGEDRPCVKWARVVIAKATGEQP